MSDPREVLTRYLDAANACDVDALLALYADDVRVMDAFGSWRVEGKEAWAKGVRDWLGEMTPGGWCRAEQVRVDTGSDMAVVSAEVLYGARTRDGGEAEVWNRWTAVLRDLDGQWLIVHEHTSVPLTTDSMDPLDH